MKKIYHIGIDPGVNTGIAVWESTSKTFELLVTTSILDAMKTLEIYTVFHSCKFYIEDPNKRKWFGESGRERLQGAGSIKRDFSIWMEWFKEMKVEPIKIAPKNNKTKLDSKQFEKLTNHKGRTNQHNRDAAMLVFSR